MPRRRQHWIVIVLIWGLSGCRTAMAKDHFLTIGGGSSASNNQVSLEKNVLYLQRFLKDAGLAGLPQPFGLA